MKKQKDLEDNLRKKMMEIKSKQLQFELGISNRNG